MDNMSRISYSICHCHFSPTHVPPRTWQMADPLCVKSPRSFIAYSVHHLPLSVFHLLSATDVTSCTARPAVLPAAPYDWHRNAGDCGCDGTAAKTGGLGISTPIPGATSQDTATGFTRLISSLRDGAIESRIPRRCVSAYRRPALLQQHARPLRSPRCSQGTSPAR
jgi:hypothetical protein